MSDYNGCKKDCAYARPEMGQEYDNWLRSHCHPADLLPRSLQQQAPFDNDRALSPMDRMWEETKRAMAREEQSRQATEQGPTSRYTELGVTSDRQAMLESLHAAQKFSMRPGDCKPYGSPLPVPPLGFASVEEAVQEIAEHYATQDPLMAGMGDGKGEPWVPEKFVEAPSSHLEGILKARGERYGAFIDNATVAQGIKNVASVGEHYHRLAVDQKEAIDQIAAKISRIVTGDPDYVDNWDDIAGYAKLVADRLSIV